LAKLIEGQTQRAGREVQRGRVGHELPQVGAFQADGEAAAQVRQVVVGTMRRSDHGQAGQATLARFTLQLHSHRQPLEPTHLD